MKSKKIIAIIYAVLAAIFYAINMPVSKILIRNIEPTMMAALLYLGAGFGIGIMFFVNHHKESKEELLGKSDLPYTIGMIVLDIIAPIFLMFGLLNTTSANASLLNNFEIVATSIIAFAIFKEMISRRLWISILLVILSSAILSFENIMSLQFSWGSGLVLLAALCWGLENNCSRAISSKNTFQIVMLKGVFSGLGSLIIACFIGEKLPGVGLTLLALLLGFVAYGLSIYYYIKAQNVLGAAKTSVYYAIAPFVGAFLSFLLLKETLTIRYFVALIIMMLGSIGIVWDTLTVHHKNEHTYN